MKGPTYHIEDLQALDVPDGGLLVITTSDKLAREHLESLVESFIEQDKRVRIVVVSPGTTITTLSDEDLANLGLARLDP